jgi:hypothetical protein
MSIEELLEDLKQFITTTVSQATAGMATKGDIAAIRSEMATKTDLAELRIEMKAGHDKLSGQISDLDLKVDTIADAQAETMQDHELRLTRLEHAT